MRTWVILLAAALAVSCHDEAPRVEAVDKEINQAIAGSWLFIEYGYSPGDKYYKVPVPAIPAKTVMFNADHSMSSSGMGLDAYRYYRILEDTVADRQVIAFFEQDPGDQSLDITTLTPAYFVHWEGNDLYLNYRWCIEGCHMKFRRIRPVEGE